MSLQSNSESEQGNGGSPEPAASFNSLDALSDTELIKTVEDLETEIKHLEVENQVFENFLSKNDPALIAGMAQVLEVAARMQGHAHSILAPSPLTDRRLTSESLIASSRRTESIARFPTTTASTAERGPRLVAL